MLAGRTGCYGSHTGSAVLRRSHGSRVRAHGTRFRLAAGRHGVGLAHGHRVGRTVLSGAIRRPLGAAGAAGVA